MKKSIYSEKQRKLCDLLKRSRTKAGFTQMELAKRIGRPQSFVAKYEGGERRLDIIELLEITKIINLAVKDVLNTIA